MNMWKRIVCNVLSVFLVFGAVPINSDVSFAAVNNADLFVGSNQANISMQYPDITLTKISDDSSKYRCTPSYSYWHYSGGFWKFGYIDDNGNTQIKRVDDDDFSKSLRVTGGTVNPKYVYPLSNQLFTYTVPANTKVARAIESKKQLVFNILSADNEITISKLLEGVDVVKKSKNMKIVSIEKQANGDFQIKISLDLQLTLASIIGYDYNRQYDLNLGTFIPFSASGYGFNTYAIYEKSTGNKLGYSKSYTPDSTADVYNVLYNQDLSKQGIDIHPAMIRPYNKTDVYGRVTNDNNGGLLYDYTKQNNTVLGIPYRDAKTGRYLANGTSINGKRQVYWDASNISANKGKTLDVYAQSQVDKIIVYTPEGKQIIKKLSEITVGKGTFSNGGAQGLTFVYPLKLEIYAEPTIKQVNSYYRITGYDKAAQKLTFEKAKPDDITDVAIDPKTQTVAVAEYKESAKDVALLNDVIMGNKNIAGTTTEGYKWDSELPESIKGSIALTPTDIAYYMFGNFTGSTLIDKVISSSVAGIKPEKSTSLASKGYTKITTNRQSFLANFMSDSLQTENILNTLVNTQKQNKPQIKAKIDRGVSVTQTRIDNLKESQIDTQTVAMVLSIEQSTGSKPKNDVKQAKLQNPITHRTVGTLDQIAQNNLVDVKVKEIKQMTSATAVDQWLATVQIKLMSAITDLGAVPIMQKIEDYELKPLNITVDKNETVDNAVLTDTLTKMDSIAASDGVGSDTFLATYKSISSAAIRKAVSAYIVEKYYFPSNAVLASDGQTGPIGETLQITTNEILTDFYDDMSAMSIDPSRAYLQGFMDDILSSQNNFVFNAAPKVLKTQGYSQNQGVSNVSMSKVFKQQSYASNINTPTAETTIYARYLIIDTVDEIPVKITKNQAGSVIKTTVSKPIKVAVLLSNPLKLSLIDIKDEKSPCYDAGFVNSKLEGYKASKSKTPPSGSYDGTTLKNIDITDLTDKYYVYYSDVQAAPAPPKTTSADVPEWRLSRYTNNIQTSNANMQLDAVPEGCHSSSFGPAGAYSGRYTIYNPNGQVAQMTGIPENRNLTAQGISYYHTGVTTNTSGSNVTKNSNYANVSVLAGVNALKSTDITNLYLANWVNKNTLSTLSKYNIQSSNKGKAYTGNQAFTKAGTFEYSIKNRNTYGGTWYEDLNADKGHRHAAHGYTLGVTYNTAKLQVQTAFDRFVPAVTDNRLYKPTATKVETNGRTEISKLGATVLKVYPEVPMLFDDDQGNDSVQFVAGDMARKIQPVDYHTMQYTAYVQPTTMSPSGVTDTQARITANQKGLIGTIPVIYKGGRLNIAMTVHDTKVTNKPGYLTVKTYVLDIGDTNLKSAWGNGGYNADKVNTDFLADWNWTAKVTNRIEITDPATGNAVNFKGPDTQPTTGDNKFKAKPTTTRTLDLIVRGGTLISVDGVAVANIKANNADLYNALEGMHLVGASKDNTVLATFEHQKGDNLTEGSFAALASAVRNGVNNLAVGKGWYSEDSTTLVIREYTTVYDLPVPAFVDAIPLTVKGLETPRDKSQFYKVMSKGYVVFDYELTSTDLGQGLGMVKNGMEYDSRTPNPFGDVKVQFGVTNTTSMDQKY